MNLNPFNKPPLNKIFKNTNDEKAPEKPMPISVESSSESQVENTKSSIAWKKFLTLFLVGALSVESVEAASMSMTAEEKKDAIEYMKSSPEVVKAYEQKLLEKAKSVEAIPDGITEDGMVKTKKSFPIDLENAKTAAYIEYVNGEAVSVSVRETEASGGKKIISDGYRGEKMDGIVDHITIINPDKSKIQYGFIETTNAKGERIVQLTGINLSQGGANTALVNSQKAFEETIAEMSK